MTQKGQFTWDRQVNDMVPKNVSQEEAEKARAVVRAFATDPEDAHALLTILGLQED